MRDGCPGVLRLHQAADGGLARVRLPGGRIGAAGLRGLGDAARLGSGLIELTSRASVQIRGLPPEAAERCATVLYDAGLLPSSSHERVRNILASPVAGRHPDSLAQTDEIVAELDRALCADARLSELSGRFLFAVDDGTRLLGEHVADVALVAIGADEFRLELDGVPTTRRAAPRDAATMAVEAARELLQAQPDRPRPPGADAPPLTADVDPTSCGPRISLGTLRQLDGRIALTTAPRLGRLNVALVRALAALVEERHTELRLSPQRTLTLPDLSPETVADVRDELLALGLIDDPASGWNGLSACSGLGRCAKALLDVRGEAERRASERAAGALAEHWAACERCCGRPGGAHVAYIATPDGVRREEADGP